MRISMLRMILSMNLTSVSSAYELLIVILSLYEVKWAAESGTGIPQVPSGCPDRIAAPQEICQIITL